MNDSRTTPLCITGKSKSGQCGHAAFCDTGRVCCAGCKRDCNMRCGWLDVKENETKKEENNA